MKTHFASAEGVTESDNNIYWSDALCGIESEILSDDWNMVTCKKCLRRKAQYKEEMKTAMEHNIKDMQGFNEFIKANPLTL